MRHAPLSIDRRRRRKRKIPTNRVCLHAAKPADVDGRRFAWEAHAGTGKTPVAAATARTSGMRIRCRRPADRTSSSCPCHICLDDGIFTTRRSSSDSFYDKRSRRSARLCSRHQTLGRSLSLQTTAKLNFNCEGSLTKLPVDILTSCCKFYRKLGGSDILWNIL